MSHQLRSYDYVNQPYPRVRASLLANPRHVFRHATAADATQSARLHVRLGPLDVGADVEVSIATVEESTAYEHPATKLGLAWQAMNHPGMFPILTGTLTVFALSPTETQLELAATYVPPLGVVGQAIDRAVLHRIAEATVKRFVEEVAGWLREELARPAAVAPHLGVGL